MLTMDRIRKLRELHDQVATGKWVPPETGQYFPPWPFPLRTESIGKDGLDTLGAHAAMALPELLDAAEKLLAIEGKGA